MTLYFISAKKEKFLEINKIIPNIQMLNLDLEEIQELDPKKIIQHKLMQAIKSNKSNIFCEDSSLYINCLNGFPGPLIKWLIKSIGDKGLAELVLKYKDHSAIAKTLIGYTNGKEIKYFEGSTLGTIVMSRGNNGFGWDKIFIPSGNKKTFGEMSIEEKNQFSHRATAAKLLKEYLEK